ncbi:P-loop containing nucleoside triphosphate hydrolase protein [Lindgomyces ingoldianus]|uniref:P-loop containing nucleoside triphosphate hydrolase protein n=1 Tax=Lindgomyces ingoldianus TaxID=673940 RepID=A0ACB6QHC0_9PLEO|nr:P-loop containing nucleoside triphosphate hydrolase protein [Lindgomyces ingoldianus]KAF2465545.1 P-loop containing nucleoside triphosphate hydrolase protein [Lindgomyces ingoldianus]
MASHPNSPHWELDVYATPFVPHAFKSVNNEHATVIATDTKHQVDFAAYTETFAARHFVPQRYNATIPPPEGTVNHPPLDSDLSVSSYSEFWSPVYNVELSAKLEENDTYTLYNVPLVPTASQEGHQLYRLLVPGLREETPFVELGDTIQLRQLHLDPYGNLVQLPVYFGTQKPIFLTWGGVQYDATVEDINRAYELVFIRVKGLVPQTMRFNVVFSMRRKLISVQWAALHLVSSELLRILAKPGPLGSREVHEELLQRTASMTLTTSGHSNQTNGANGEIQSQDDGAPNDWIRRMLFPVDSDGVIQEKLRTLPWKRGLFDPKLNYEQLSAVDCVCRSDYGVLPYLISGPPGTGKTKTLVELAMQLIKDQVDHVLICAPSDAAADTLALRLSKHLKPSQLFRLNGPGRTVDEVPQALRGFCYRTQDKDPNMYNLPPFPQLMKYLIVVTSTRDASILMNAKVTNSDLYTIEMSMLKTFHPESQVPAISLHWGALLIDEAAQATELESLFALSIVMPPPSYPSTLPQPQFAMAGDENQLGPRTASKNPHLTTSLFARLFARPLYANHPLSRSNLRPSTSPPVLTAAMLPMNYPAFENLTRNYRSHPAILSVSSSLFYNDTLIPESQPAAHPLHTSPIWTHRNWPVKYIPHRGLDEIERDGGGWYNVSEARIACNLAQYLFSSAQVPQAEIIIMSPFAAQVKLLRKEMRSARYGNGSGLFGVNIGPLEAFQGLESRVVIICTTRARPKFVKGDVERGLGVVGMRQRMNMAITRAKEGLFVIGNPEVLAMDEWWREWVAFCLRNGLVSEDLGIHAQRFKGGKVGVLEKALVIKEEKAREETAGRLRVLGGAVLGQGVDEDEMWALGLRAAMEEWEEEGGGGEEDEEDEEN